MGEVWPVCSDVLPTVLVGDWVISSALFIGLSGIVNTAWILVIGAFTVPVIRWRLCLGRTVGWVAFPECRLVGPIGCLIEAIRDAVLSGSPAGRSKSPGSCVSSTGPFVDDIPLRSDNP
jgi:hypothetical protein